jgi:phosphoglycerate dehydrogenase-like enzyme
LRRRVDVVHESWLDSRRLQDPGELGLRLHTDAIDVLVVEADFVFPEVFEAAPNLRLVGVCRNALNQVDVGAATRHGVAVSHARGRNTNAVAEMTIGLMIALTRRIPQAHYLVSGGGWRDPALGYRELRGREIAGAKVGIIGFGQIGREVARKCIALNARVVAYDPFVPERQMKALGVRKSALASLSRTSDFVTVHAAEAEEARRMLDAAFFARVKSGAYFINTSAGGLVDHSALMEALETGRLAGAALDVFDGHPLPASSPLMSAPNLLLTPHIGGATAETIERHSRIMAGEVERLIDGGQLRFCVNPAYIDYR